VYTEFDDFGRLSPRRECGITNNVIPGVTLDVTLNGTEMMVLAILKQKTDSSRDEIADKISKTSRTVQRALDSLREKGYIRRVGSKQTPTWEILK
jgi:ATP-dependent DNA helicase RecG